VICPLGDRRKGPRAGSLIHRLLGRRRYNPLLTEGCPSRARPPGGHTPPRRATEAHCGSGTHCPGATFFDLGALDPHGPPLTSLGVPELGVHRLHSTPGAALLSALAAGEGTCPLIAS